jgi:ATP-dependent helicase HrpB
MLQVLPIDAYLPEIVAAAKAARALVIVAEPGAGKTTRVPPALLGEGIVDAGHPALVMLQPRRVAARAAATRIAAEQRWSIGNQVGWHVRFDKTVGPRTRLRVLTEGILTRQVIDDPFLAGIGGVILDEFHERSIHTDLTIALLREVRQTVRPDLVLIVMSATLDAAPVAKFLGDCPIINVPGRTYPVEVAHAPMPSAEPLPQRLAGALRDELERGGGDVLAFLPGVFEIDRSAEEIAALAGRHDLKIVPLHGSLPPDQQMRALEPSDRRKVILATNIAETSLTIQGVKVVIDSGLARVAGFDAERGLDRLDLKRISKASAIQRAGRAGRTAPGRCVRLYTAREFHAMSDFELPEIRRVDLAGTVLSLHAWGKTDLRGFGWYDLPPEEALAAAERLLTMLGALDAATNGRITRIGQQMVSLPVHPRLARLLIAAAENNCLDDGAAMAALLSECDIAPIERGRDRVPATQGASDLLLRFDLIRQSPQVSRVRDELLRVGRYIKPSKKPSPRLGDEPLLKLPLLAYPDRVCRRREHDPAAAVMVGGSGARLAPESVVRQYEFFLALDARRDDRNPRSEASVRIASGIEMAWLEELFPQAISRTRELTFDPARQRVVALGMMKYHDLVLREDADAPVDPEKAGHVLAAALKDSAAERLSADESADILLARLDLLKRHMPEHPWPTIQPAEILEAMCQGKRSVEELSRVSPVPFILACLPYPLDRLLEEHAPAAIEVPTGNRIKLQYAIRQPPVLAVRLQEMFGLVDTPRIAGGRVPVTLHLLGPNYRPVQITNDLRSFWKTTYFQVRKDLRVRYPKHSWPEDPLTAPPQAKGSRRR